MNRQLLCRLRLSHSFARKIPEMFWNAFLKLEKEMILWVLKRLDALYTGPWIFWCKVLPQKWSVYIHMISGMCNKCFSNNGFNAIVKIPFFSSFGEYQLAIHQHGLKLSNGVDVETTWTRCFLMLYSSKLLSIVITAFNLRLAISSVRLCQSCLGFYHELKPHHFESVSSRRAMFGLEVSICFYTCRQRKTVVKKVNSSFKTAYTLSSLWNNDQCFRLLGNPSKRSDSKSYTQILAYANFWIRFIWGQPSNCSQVLSTKPTRPI